jgi:hypothetical protein
VPAVPDGNEKDFHVVLAIAGSAPAAGPRPREGPVARRASTR